MMLLAWAMLIVGMFSSTAHASHCASLQVRQALTCSSVIHDEIEKSTPNLLTGPYTCPNTYPQKGGEHIYSFTCQQNGTVTLLIDDLECDLDIYVLGETCDTRNDCLGESVAGSNTRDEVSFECTAGKTYTIAIEGFGWQRNAERAGRCSSHNDNKRGVYTLSFDVSAATGGCLEHCTDGQDNDQDGAIDCDDPDCSGEEGCIPVVTDLSFDLSNLPDTCYTNADCGGEVRLLLPAGQEAVWTALLSDSQTTIRLNDHGQAVPLTSTTPLSHTLNRPQAEPTTRTWQMEVMAPGRDTIASQPHPVTWHRPLNLVTPGVIDFGTVAAGTGTFTNCQTLDLSGSQALEDHLFSVTFTPPAGGCEAEPVIRSGSVNRPKAVDFPIEGFALSPITTLCLDVPACDGEVIEGASLHIQPLAPDFSDQAAEITLLWNVEGRTWLSCNLWWILILIGTGMLIWFIAGWVTPARFPREATIAVAGSEKGLRRSIPIRLRELRGSRPGFYRDARLGIHADGSVNGRTKNAMLIIRATKTSSIVIDKGAFEVRSRRTRKWEIPEDAAAGHEPLSNTLYRAGDTWFTFEL